MFFCPLNGKNIGQYNLRDENREFRNGMYGIFPSLNEKKETNSNSAYLLKDGIFSNRKLKDENKNVTFFDQDH
jgi:hypothetical protein